MHREDDASLDGWSGIILSKGGIGRDCYQLSAEANSSQLSRYNYTMDNSKIALQRMKSDRMIYKIKAECHRLMEFIWGKHRRGRRDAYMFLRKTFGKDIHFSEINDYQTLFLVRKELYAHAVERDLLTVDDLNDFFKTI